MSLYTMGEICDGCRHAILYNCGNCLKECKIRAIDKANCINGSCTEYIKEEEKNLQIVEKAYNYFIEECYTEDHSACYLAELLRQYLKRFE